MNTKKVADVNKIGSWQEVFERTCTDRVKKAIKRAVRTPEICLEHARAEIAVHEETDGKVPKVIQRALIFKKYLEDRTIFIADGELIVGNVNSKQRGSTIIGDLYANTMDAELGDPERDYQIRSNDRHNISEEERKELREVIIPYFKGRTLADAIYAAADAEVLEYGFMGSASCKHIPVFSDLMIYADAGHMLANYEKVLKIGLKGIREEALFYQKNAAADYIHFEKKEKADFYEAVIISLDAAIAHAQRYSDLAKKMAEEESDPVRKAELEEVSRICAKVPAEPAETWHEALQSVWMLQTLILCEQINYADSFGTFDRYMYPYYKKSVEEDKSITRDQALELMELFLVKTAEYTQLYDYESANYQVGFPISQNLLLGGQAEDGSDACNEVTMLVLEGDEQVGLMQPEVAFRIWEGTPTKYLRKAAEVVRLGRGKPKFYGDRTAIQMQHKAYPNISMEELRNYAVIGCVEIALPHITMEHSFCGVQNMAKVLELTIHNGKCACCGRQIGPMTGDPRTFESMEQFKEAFREQAFHWARIMCKAVTTEMEVQAKWNMAPFASSLIEGPLQKGKDLIQGGAEYTSFGLMIGGSANTGDSLAVIDQLIYREKKVTWDEMIEALKDNWQGHDRLRQLVINAVPKYGNDNDYPDNYVAYVQNVWYDAVDWVNTQNELLPSYGGRYRGTSAMANQGSALGALVGSLPDGFIGGTPLADAMSPTQGRDVCGTTAVLKSMSKLPLERYEMGALLNQRLTPQLLATEEDLDRFVSYLRTFEALGLYHIQFNVINSDTLIAAQKEPEKYQDLLVRVASYVSYFIELDPRTQNDIINRTQQDNW